MSTEIKKKKRVWIISISIAVVILATVTVLIYMHLSSKWAQEAEDNMQAEALASRFSVSKEYAMEKKEKYGDWDKAGLRLMQEAHMFSPERATELYRQGYLVEDMEKAQQLEVDSGVDREKILKCRGHYPGQKPWKKVIKELKLDLRSDAEKLGMSKDGIKALKKAGADESQIINLALKINAKEYSEEELLNKIENGSSIDSLLK